MINRCKLYKLLSCFSLLSPLWCENRWLAMTEIGRALDKDGAQGSLTDDAFIYSKPELKAE